MKRLPHELRARPTPMHPGLFSATGQHGGDSAITLQLAGAAVAVALCSECGDQTWHQGGTRSRQRIKDYEIRMLARGGFDLLIVGLNRPTQFSQKRNQGSDRSDAGFYYSLVVGGRYPSADFLQPALNVFGTTTVMLNKELYSPWSAPSLYFTSPT